MTYQPVVGKHVLESLTAGMYSAPLIVYRECIQNSTDAIDHAVRVDKSMGRDDAVIRITIDGKKKSISIWDNGCGVRQSEAQSTLLDLGHSTKNSVTSRGFRGIGRLGGIGYCKTLTFRTKAACDKVVSVNTWNCEKLRQLVYRGGKHRGTASSTVKQVTAFKEEEWDGDPQEHFFEVVMEDVESLRDILLNVKAVRSWIGMVAPVPFDSQSFSFAQEIDERLRAEVQNYETFVIVANEELITKPYSDTFLYAKNKKDKIKCIHWQDICDRDKHKIAIAWYAESSFLGQVLPSEKVGGIRMRIGNILIGDCRTLEACFKENRFNGWAIGEVHAAHPDLVPNARRDDFEQNPTKGYFLESFTRTIGHPLSAMARGASSKRSIAKTKKKSHTAVKQAQQAKQKGVVSHAQSEHIRSELKSAKHSLASKGSDLETQKRKVEKQLNLLEDEEPDHIVDLQLANLPRKERERVKILLDAVFDGIECPTEADKIIRRAVNALKRYLRKAKRGR